MSVMPLSKSGRRQLRELLFTPGIGERLDAAVVHYTAMYEDEIAYYKRRQPDAKMPWKERCETGCKEPFTTNHLSLLPWCRECGHLLPNLRDVILHKWQMSARWHGVGPTVAESDKKLEDRANGLE